MALIWFSMRAWNSFFTFGISFVGFSCFNHSELLAHIMDCLPDADIASLSNDDYDYLRNIQYNENGKDSFFWVCVGSG